MGLKEDREETIRKSTSLNIKLLPGNVAPKYDEDIKVVDINKVVVTEQGMESGRPIVDFQLTDADGNKYFAVLTGRLVQTLGKVIDGVNIRNHGSAYEGTAKTMSDA